MIVMLKKDEAEKDRDAMQQTTTVGERISYPNWLVEGKNGVSFLHDKMAAFIMGMHHLVKYPNADGDLYIYDVSKGYYVPDKKKNLLKGIIRRYQVNLRVSQVNEVLQLIHDTSKVVSKLSSGVVAVKNGLLYIDSDTNMVNLNDFTPDVFVTSKLDVNYNPDVYDSHVASTLNKVTNGHIETINNLEEMFGCILYPQRLVTRMFYLYGKTAHNGKSAVLSLAYNVFGRENISAETPQRLADNSFAASSLIRKTANIVDDLPDKVIEDIGHLKSITTGAPIQTERKGEGSQTTVIDAVLIFASNFFPNFKENGKQVDRRLWIIPFEHDFSSDPERLSDFEAEQRASTTSAKEYVLKLAVDGLLRLLRSATSERLTPNPRVDEILGEFKEHNDPFFNYFQDFKATDFLNRKGMDAYKEYCSWCSENRIKHQFGVPRWKDAVMNYYNLEWKDIRWVRNGRSENGKGFSATDKTPTSMLVAEQH